MTLKINFKLGILVSVITIILIYWIHLKSNKVEGFEENNENISLSEMNSLLKDNSSTLSWYADLKENNEPQIYAEAYSLSVSLAPMLKYNLKINNRLPEYDTKTGQMFQKILVPTHLINLLDGRVLAVFNDGKLYIKTELFNDQLWLGPLENSLYGSSTDGIGMRMVMLFPLNHNQERQIRLIGIGQDSIMYYKETENIQSPWLKAETNNTNNDNLVYLFCDYHQLTEDYYPLLYGITQEGAIVYKNLDGKAPIPSIEDVDFIKVPFNELTPPINDNIKILKIFWDKNGFMLGIGQDFRLYQKKGIDWKVRPWENSEERRGTNSGSNTQLIDVYMDNDSRMVGLVLDSQSNPPTIRIKKQNMTYYLADFEEIGDISNQNRLLNDQQMIKYKTGLDWTVYLSFEDPDEILYRSNNLQALHQRSVMFDKFKLRKLCKDRKPTMNLEARNFDLEKAIETKSSHISSLNNELEGLLKYIS
jgi:hypothetical protein